MNVRVKYTFIAVGAIVYLLNGCQTATNFGGKANKNGPVHTETQLPRTTDSIRGTNREQQSVDLPPPVLPAKPAQTLDHSQSNKLREAYKQFLALKGQGRDKYALPFAKLAVELSEKEFGKGHPNVAFYLRNHAELYTNLGQYGDAEPLFRKALTIVEKAKGVSHPDFSEGLSKLAMMYLDQGRYEDAELLLKRVLEIDERSLPADDLNKARHLHNLGKLLIAQDRYFESEVILEESLSIQEKILGRDHLSLARNLNDLGRTYKHRGRYGDARKTFKRALKIDRKLLAADHPRLATSLINSALVENPRDGTNSIKLGFMREQAIRSMPLLMEAWAIIRKAFGPKHPKLAAVLHDLANVYLLQGQDSTAHDFIRKSTSIYQSRASLGEGREVGTKSERKSRRDHFTSHVRIASYIGKSYRTNIKVKRDNSLISESFIAGQLAMATQAGFAVSSMAARFAAGNDDLGKIVRDHQDALSQWRKLDERLVRALSSRSNKRDAAGERTLRTKLDVLEKRILATSKRLAIDFPKYSQLAADQPVAVSEIQKLLAPDEALVVFLAPESTEVYPIAEIFAWVIRRDNIAFSTEIGNGYSVQAAIDKLRATLDPTRIVSFSDLPVFDRREAYGLYQKLFAPIEDDLEGANHVFVVPDGALQSLPLGVLVTSPPNGEISNYSDYRKVPWLAKKYALTTLPSVSSLSMLRRYSAKANNSVAFTGIGDPVLRGHPGSNRGIEIASLYRGTIADVEAIRNLPPLPETADELRMLLAATNGDPKQLYLGSMATEEVVKSADLSKSRIVAFATHALVAGDLENAEPALVLTPPTVGSEIDDGLLTSSEVSQLKLNADFVILSACNTASGDSLGGGEGLSGLAKSFFYAGSRALLVSHWPIASDATVNLTTAMMDFQADNPEIGLAEALQQSMMALMNIDKTPLYAHPMFWAPFVVVGEGGLTLSIR